MMRATEETLNAYADGALDADARAEVESQLATDAAARAFLEKLRRANALAREAFAEPFQEPPPQTLIDMILQAPDTVESDGVIPLDVPTSRRRTIRHYSLPLAAALALAIGLAAGLLLGRQPAQEPNAVALGDVAPGSQMYRLLERHPSGSILDMPAQQGLAQRLSVVATFRDRHARPCREIEVLPPVNAGQQPLAAAVACRGPNGSWTVEGTVRLTYAPSATAGQFEPSGVPEKDALDGLLAMLGAQTALSSDDERLMMQRGWQ